MVLGLPKEPAQRETTDCEIKIRSRRRHLYFSAPSFVGHGFSPDDVACAKGGSLELRFCRCGLTISRFEP